MEGLQELFAAWLREAWALAWPVLVMVALVVGFAILFLVTF